MARCQATRLAPHVCAITRHTRSHRSNTMSVYKFMIITSLLHISVTNRVLLPFRCFLPPPPPPPLLPVVPHSRPMHTDVSRSLLSTSRRIVCRAPAQRDDDPILHLYSTVRDSLQSAVACTLFGFAESAGTAGEPRRGSVTARNAKTRVSREERGACALLTHFRLFIFLFNARFVPRKSRRARFNIL